MMIKYVIQPGDTLWKIAERFGGDVDTISRMNNIADPNRIYPKQVLRLWVEEENENENTFPQESVEYIVQPGDTLYIIAQKYGTTVPHLINLNGLTNPDRLNIGDRIIVR